MSSVKACLYVRHDNEGSHSTIRLLESATVNGGLWPPSSEFVIFSTNPGVFGLPNKTIEVGGQDYEVEELLDVLGRDGKEEVGIMFSHHGEILVEKKLS